MDGWIDTLTDRCMIGWMDEQQFLEESHKEQKECMRQLHQEQMNELKQAINSQRQVRKNKIKYFSLPRIFITKGGSEFAAYPLPSIRVGSSMPYTAFSTAPSRNATLALGSFFPFCFIDYLSKPVHFHPTVSLHLYLLPFSKSTAKCSCDSI
jgi:hypothetical protein